MSVNGERVYVPSSKRELIAGLRRMGITQVAGVSLSRARKKELLREYCRVKYARQRRQQRRRLDFSLRLPTQGREDPESSGPTQLSLFDMLFAK